MAITFLHEQAVHYGTASEIGPLVRRIVARNPSPFTYHGTGTYVVGRGNVALIDPGPDLVEHVDALLAALPGERITHQLITHTHSDHSPAARHVRERTGAQTYGFGPHAEGRHERGVKVEAGGDMSFVPDVALHHGDVIEGDGFSIECVHTPGHCSNHLCFALREQGVLFTGDHVMGWSTSVISPPDGDMSDYLRSLQLLLDRDDRTLLPAHGPAIDSPKGFVLDYIEHRKERERQIIDCLAQGVEHIGEMVPRMYQSTPAILHRAAARSVFAHVLDLLERGAIESDEAPSLEARYRLK